MQINPGGRTQHRGVILAPNGMVATGHPLASAAGARVLGDGGNAIDAAFTAAAVLGVVQPMMSGLGGESFLLYYDRSSQRTWAVNGSGPAPRALSLDYLHKHTGGTLPPRGMLSAGVPGAVDVMCTALERWGGRFDLGHILAPAIRYAEDGVPVAESVAAIWALEQPTLARFPSSMRTLLRDGRAYRVGERLRMPDYAAALRCIAAGGRDAFYTGALAERIAAYCRSHGGLLDEADLAAYRCEVGAPIETTYRDYTVQTTAPPSQGTILLEELNLVETFDLQRLPWGGADAVHAMVEAKKLAFADRNAYLGDPRFRVNPLSAMLSKEYARHRREAIRMTSALHAADPGALPEQTGETTYLCTADRDGNLVSLITSLSSAFGGAEVVEDTGILLNNRVGRGFSTDPASPNVLAPAKRTMHTLHPYLVFRGEEPLLVGGTPGGDAQPQINLQVLTNMLDWGMNVQQAIEAPRWWSVPGTDPSSVDAPFELRLESGFARETRTELERRGHTVISSGAFTWFGAQVIKVDREAGCYHGGSDPRVDGCAIGY
jgi:gamma-glutamyltranspeptidase/glutathione hydrolase